MNDPIDIGYRIDWLNNSSARHMDVGYSAGFRYNHSSFLLYNPVILSLRSVTMRR
jgi:hypothetical protein